MHGTASQNRYVTLTAPKVLKIDFRRILTCRQAAGTLDVSWSSRIRVLPCPIFTTTQWMGVRKTGDWLCACVIVKIVLQEGLVFFLERRGVFETSDFLWDLIPDWDCPVHGGSLEPGWVMLDWRHVLASCVSGLVLMVSFCKIVILFSK